MKKLWNILGALGLTGLLTFTALAAPAAPIDVQALADCSQEMTTCPCAGIPVNKDLVRPGDLLMIRIKGTPVVSFPYTVQ